MPPRARTPSPYEARILTVYTDAERYLLDTVRTGVEEVADADPYRDGDARTRGATRVREAVEAQVRGLVRAGPGRVEAIVSAGTRGGIDDATAQLARLRARADATPSGYEPGINRAALDRLAAATVTRLDDGHAAILRTVPDAYQRAIARVVPGVLVGVLDRREAAQRAMWALTDEGITSFTDRRGRRWRLSSYVEMATRTAAARAHVDAQLDVLRSQRQRFVQVGDAARCCPRCAPWEGETLAIDASGPTGRIRVPSALDGQVTIDVAGTVAQARTAGLLHPGCRHALSLYLPGVTRPLVVERDPAGYVATQRQRAIERHIRAWKEREAAAIDPGARRRAAAARKGWQAGMRAHLAEHPDLLRVSHREGIDAGNAPSEALRARLAGGPLPVAVRGEVRVPRRMTSAEIERRLTTATGAERDRLDAERARRAAAAATRARRAGGRTP